MSRMKFRGTLLRVSDQLSNLDLDHLKFLCRTVIPNARMEKIVSGLDLFNALEERGQLSPDNVDFLHIILSSAGCDTPMRQLSKDGFFPNQQESMVYDEEYRFHECLLKLAISLASREFDEIKFYLQPCLNQSLDKIYTATELFQLLKQRRTVTSKDMKVLFDVMIEIGRNDLGEMINVFLRSIGQQPYQTQAPITDYPIPASPRGATTLHHPVEATPDEHIDRQLQLPSAISSGFVAGRGTPNSSLSSHQQQSLGGSSRTTSGTSLSSMASTGSRLSTLSEIPGQPSSGLTFSSLSPSQSGLSLNNDGKAVPVNSYMQYPTGGTPLPKTSQYAYPEVRGTPEVRGSPFQQDENIELNHLGLTFDPRADLLSTPGMLDPNQQLIQEQLEKKEKEVFTKEQQIQQYIQEIQQLKGQIGSTSREHQSKESEYMVRIREYEQLLDQLTREVERQREEKERLHFRLSSPDTEDDEADYYKMDKTPHGICLIINNHEFYHAEGSEKAHPNRGGAHVDRHNLEQTFKYLHYKVEVVENLSAQQMNAKMLEMALRDHSKYDSFLCCILTHGEKDVVHGADSKPVNLNDLTGVMKMCTTLQGKPKLFLVQACRGDAEGEAIKIKDEDIQQDTGGGPYSNTIPKEADFFFGFATPTGNAAYRSRRYGSWFISEVCQVFVNNAYKLNLNAMMKKVNNRVSKAYTKDGNKQAPEFVDRLRFQVHFFRFVPNCGPGVVSSRAPAGRR